MRLWARLLQFQSTPPHGRRPTLSEVMITVLSAFQSTPPHGRRLGFCALSTIRRSSFNPRLRTGGDRQFDTHAAHVVRFNPRLRTGGDDRRTIPRPFREGFNPRLRTGGDCAARQRAQCRSVSIHASAREATQHVDRGYGPDWFQSTPPHGRRLCLCGDR